MSLPTKVNVPRPEAWGYDVLVEYGTSDAETLYLRGAVGPGRQMTFQTVEAVQGNPDLSDNPEDMRGETGQSFSRENFTGGEGLDRAHRRGGSDRDFSRFWDSRNIDVTSAIGGVPEEIKLLHTITSLRSAAATATRAPLVRLGDVLYGVIANKQRVDRSANPITASPTWTVENPNLAEGDVDVTDLAGLGDELYAAVGIRGIHKRDNGGTWTHWSDLTNTERVWGVKARIIASTGAALHEARAGTGSVLLKTLPSGEIWNDVVDAGSAILAAASDGNIYAFVEEDADLVLKGQTEIPNEVPTALGFGQGLVFIGTSQSTSGGGQIGRLWRSLFVGLRLREGQVIRKWGDGSTTQDRSPKRIISTREAIWIAVVEDGSETHLWRYHLATGGLVRDLIIVASGVSDGLVVFDDRMFVTVLGDAIWREATTFASTGYLIGPLADFFNAARKSWIGARLTTGTTLPAGTKVVLAYSTDPDALEDSAHASWVDVITATGTPDVPGDSAEQAITNVEARYLTGKLTLTPEGGATLTPNVLAFALRGLPQPTEDDYAIPINISDRLELPHRKPLRAGRAKPGLTVYDKLKDIMGKVTTVTLLRSGEVVKGQLRTLSAPINEIPERGSPTVYALLTTRGQRQ